MSNYTDKAVESFFTIAKKKEKDVHQWCVNTVMMLIDEAQFRTEQQRTFLEAYRGFDSDSSIRSRDKLDPYRNSKRRIRKLKVNHIFDIIESKVSQMTRLKSDISVLPRHAEYGDKATAKVANAVIKNIFELEQFDNKMIDMQRLARVLGEIYIKWDFNKDKGDPTPAYLEAVNMGLSKVTDPETGKTIDLSKPIKVGDVEGSIRLPWRILLQRKTSYSEVDWGFEICIEEKDKVKKDNPSKANEIDMSTGVTEYSTELLEEVYLEDHVAVYEFYHRKTSYLPDGMKIRFTQECILEMGPLPFDHGELPYERLTDVDFPTVLNGISKLEFALLVQQRYDDITTLIAKNIYLTAHAKWVVPQSARVKIEQLGNDNTIVTHAGPIGPQLIQVQPNPPEVYNFRESLKQELQVIMGAAHGIARGEIPKGVTATSAFVFLNELESERSSSEISKHADFVKRCAKKALSLAGQYYDVSDGRLIRVVGKNNKFLIRHFDAADLTKPYDIKYESSSGFPETRAAKEQRLQDIMQRNPNLFSAERWEQLFELSDVDKAVSISTAAITSADSENEDMLAGLEVGDPEKYEEQLTHWKAHLSAMQNRSFKEEASNEAYLAFLDHIEKHERIMIDMGKTNPTFGAQLATLVNFPIGNHKGFEPFKTMEQVEAEVQGQANRGEPVSQIVPGKPEEGNNGQ